MQASTAGQQRLAEIRRQFQEDGCALIPQLLDAAGVAHCRRCFESSLDSPEKVGARFYSVQGGEENSYFYNDATGYRGPLSLYSELLEALPILSECCAEIWGCENVWFFGHELFHKTGGEEDESHGRRTPFHQDTAVIPFGGEHLANLWIPLQDTPQAHSLEIIRGSHRGPCFAAKGIASVPSIKKQPAAKRKAVEPTSIRLLPAMPSLLGNSPGQRGEWDERTTAFGAELGDVVLLHPGCIHGGGPVSPSFPQRDTLVRDKPSRLLSACN